MSFRRLAETQCWNQLAPFRKHFKDAGPWRARMSMANSIFLRLSFGNAAVKEGYSDLRFWLL